MLSEMYDQFFKVPSIAHAIRCIKKTMKKRDISGNRKKLCLHLQPIAAPLLPQSEAELKESIRVIAI